MSVISLNDYKHSQSGVCIIMIDEAEAIAAKLQTF